jgi:hypothetical protein
LQVRLLIMLRAPEARAISHLGMLTKLARRGVRWAALYAGPNVTADARLLGEARRLHACFHARAAAGVATAGGAGGAVMGGAVTGAPTRRLTSKLWNECVAVACGFHACVVAQVRDDL